MDNERTDNNYAFIEYLKTFVDNSEKEISDLKSKLEWLDNDSSLVKNDNTCVHNPQHTNIAERNFDKHLAKCSFLSKNDFVSAHYLIDFLFWICDVFFSLLLLINRLSTSSKQQSIQNINLKSVK